MTTRLGNRVGRTLLNVRGYLDATLGEQVELLSRLVQIDSGTDDKAGTDAVAGLLGDGLADLGLAIEYVQQERVGMHLIARKPGAGGPTALLVGHSDTVYTTGTAWERPFRIEAGRAFGPGVLDMKGGLVVMLFGLKALRATAPESWNRLGITVVVNSDEESGSETSKEMLIREARRSNFACVFEPARKGGEYVSQRKGAATFTVTVHGRAAHAGIQPELGANAIAELASKIVALHRMSDLAQGLTVNVGVIHGGTVSSVVPDSARCEVDVRFPSRSMLEDFERRLTVLAARVTVAGTETAVAGGAQIYPMECTLEARRLFGVLAEVGEREGLPVRHVATGGGSDGNTTAQFTPTLDGFGAWGDFAHSPNEFVFVDSLPHRAAVFAGFLDACGSTRVVKESAQPITMPMIAAAARRSTRPAPQRRRRSGTN